MKRHLLLTLAIVLALAVGWSALASASTPEEAKAMVQKAIAMAKEKGLDETYKAIRDKHGPFYKGELYVFVSDINTMVMVVHPEKPVLEGKSQAGMKDVNGKLFYQELVSVAKEKGSGWVDYYWTKPGEKVPTLKTTYVERVPGTDLFFGCGVYK